MFIDPHEILSRPMAKPADLNVRTINVRIESVSEWQLTVILMLTQVHANLQLLAYTSMKIMHT